MISEILQEMGRILVDTDLRGHKINEVQQGEVNLSTVGMAYK